MAHPLNQTKDLHFISGKSLPGLLDDLRSIKGYIEIISIYAMGTDHVIWFKSDAKTIVRRN